MEKSLFYIEPSAIHFSKKYPEGIPDSVISAFLDEFEELLRIMAQGKHHFIIDSVMGRRIIDETGESVIPVKISEIKSMELKGRVSRLRQTFYATISPMAIYVDTDICSIMNEKLSLKPEENNCLLDDSDYCDFFHSLAGECYRKEQKSSWIITLPSYTRFTDKTISIICKCEKSSFENDFQCIVSDGLRDDKNDARSQLREVIGDIRQCTESEIVVTQAEHHPSVGRTNIESYKEIPRRSRCVLDVLLKFGLYKMEIRDWKSHKGSKGNIHNCFRIDEKSDDSHEILEGWWILDDMSCKLALYFQKNIGSLLIRILGRSFYYNDVLDLKDDMF